METFYEWFLVLYEDTGINLPFLYDDYDRGRILNGLWTTIKLSFTCVLFSVIIGMVGAWLQGSPWKLTRRVVNFYVQLFRNTPPLVQLYFFYFAVGILIPRVENGWGGTSPLIDSFGWAVISLSFFAGAFNVEIFRSLIEAVPKSMMVAAIAL